MNKNEVVNTLKKDYVELENQRNATNDSMKYVKLNERAEQLFFVIRFIETYLDDSKTEETKPTKEKEEERKS